MHSGTVNAKSFTMFSLNQGLLARCVEAVQEGDKLARQSGQIQSFEVFRNGFRMNLVIGRIMVIPPSVCESKEDFPVSLLYGALVREIRPEDLSDLMSAKIGDSEFDEYDTADMQEIKEKLFQVPGTKKYTSLILFLPSWTSPREYVMFKYIKDEQALANALRHLVFAAYYDPRLSSAFDHIMQDTDTVDHGTELDVTNITPKLNYPGVAEGSANEYPKLESADETEASQDRPTGPGSKKKKKASGPKIKMVITANAAADIHADELASGEVDVIDAVTEAAEAAILKKRVTVADVAADDNAAKKTASEPQDCPSCGQPVAWTPKDSYRHVMGQRNCSLNDDQLQEEMLALREPTTVCEEHIQFKDPNCPICTQEWGEQQGALQRRPDYGKRASQVPCPFCKHTEPTSDDLEDHIARAHKNASKTASSGHQLMEHCNGPIGESHKKCPGIVDGVHCDCECHEKAEQEGIIASGAKLAAIIKTAAISVSRGEDAQGFHILLNINGTEYVLRGADADSFRKEYAAIPKPESSVNALVERYMDRMQLYGKRQRPAQAPAAPTAPATPPARPAPAKVPQYSKATGWGLLPGKGSSVHTAKGDSIGSADATHQALTNGGWVAAHRDSERRRAEGTLYTHPAFPQDSIRVNSENGNWMLNGPNRHLRNEGTSATIADFLTSMRSQKRQPANTSTPAVPPETNKPEQDLRGYSGEAPGLVSADKKAGEVDGLGEMKVKMKLNLGELPPDAQAKVVDSATGAAKGVSDASKTASTRCECVDPGCPIHTGKSQCGNTPAAGIAYRVDMEDQTGTPMCEGCLEDAADSGVFRIENTEVGVGSYEHISSKTAWQLGDPIDMSKVRPSADDGTFRVEVWEKGSSGARMDSLSGFATRDEAEQAIRDMKAAYAGEPEPYVYKIVGNSLGEGSEGEDFEEITNCPICGAVPTDFSYDPNGEVFCTSCGSTQPISKETLLQIQSGKVGSVKTSMDADESSDAARQLSKPRGKNKEEASKSEYCNCGRLRDKCVGGYAKSPNTLHADKSASTKTADTADNAANEKDGEGAIKVKTDADIKNTRGEEPTLAPDKNASAKNAEAKVFDTRTEAGLKAAEQYKAHLENKYDKVTTTPAGLDRVRIEGKTASKRVVGQRGDGIYLDGKLVAGTHKIAIANKRVRYAKNKIALHVETRIHEANAAGVMEKIIAELKARHAAIKTANPRGFLDQFESQLPAIMLEIGQGLGLQVREEAGDKFIFTDDYGAVLSEKQISDAWANQPKSAAGHKPGCQCGFCKNKGSFGKKKEDEKDEKKESKTAGGEFPLVEVLASMGWSDEGNPGEWMKDDPRLVVMTYSDGYRVYLDGNPIAEGDNAEILHSLIEQAEEVGIDSLKPPQHYASIKTAAGKGTAGASQLVTGLPHEATSEIVSANLERFAVSNISAESNRTKQARAEHEKKLALLRRTVVADESDDLFAEVTEPFGDPPEVKVKNGDGRPDGATPKLAVQTPLLTEQNVRETLPDVQVTFTQNGKPVTITCKVSGRGANATVKPFEHGSATIWTFPWAAVRDSINSGVPLNVDEKGPSWSRRIGAVGDDNFVTDRDPQGQPKENVPEKLVIPESEPVTGVYNTGNEGSDPVGKALKSAPSMVAPVSLSEGQKPTDVEEPLDLAEATSHWLGDEPTKPEQSEQSHDAEPEAEKNASLTHKRASDRIIATLDDLLVAEPFDPENDEHPDSSLMEGLVSGPLSGGRHETNDTSGPVNKVADSSDAMPKADEPVPESEPTEEKAEEPVSEPAEESVPEAAPEEASVEEIPEVLAETGTEIIEAPPGSGKIVININAKWLKAHGIEAVGEVPTEPKGIEVYDNGGASIDRYSVLFKDFPEGPGEYAMVGMGYDCSSPQGFYQHSSAVPGEHLGKRISFYDLPETHQQRIQEELSENESQAGDGEFDVEAGKDSQVEPITSGMSNGNFGGSGAVGTDGAPDLAVQSSDEIAITADGLAQQQMDFFTGAAKTMAPHLPNVPSGGSAGEAGGAEGEAGVGGALEELAPLAVAASKTADRALPRVTTPSKDYNGWHNWETWHVALLIDNDEPLYKTKQNLVRAAIKAAKGQPVNIDRLADQMSKVLARAYQDTKSFYEGNARDKPGSEWATQSFDEVNWHEIAANAVESEQDDQEYDAANAKPEVPPASKDASTEKEAGFNFFFPGQVLREFYPEVQHEIVDYPNADNKPMIQDVDLEPSKMGTVQREAASGMTKLPDGSGFFTATIPGPDDKKEAAGKKTCPTCQAGFRSSSTAGQWKLIGGVQHYVINNAKYCDKNRNVSQPHFPARPNKMQSSEEKEAAFAMPSNPTRGWVSTPEEQKFLKKWGLPAENPPDKWEDCGSCGGAHPPGYGGDCRDDLYRWPSKVTAEPDAAQARHGASGKEACGEIEAVENALKPIEEKKQELRDEIGMKGAAMHPTPQLKCRHCGAPTEYNFCSEECAKANNASMVEGYASPEARKLLTQPHSEEKEAGSPNYVSTDPSAIGIGRDGKPQVLEGAPLRKENDIRGPMFSEEFYANYPGVPGAALKMQGSLAEFKKRAAASNEQKEMLGDFLKKVVGEIASTFVAAFKVTSRPVQLDQIPGTGEVNLVNVENSVNNWPFYAGEVGGRVKYLLEQMNDSDIADAINESWAQCSVWHSGSASGNFTYEVFVRAESIDTDNMKLKYKFVTGTKGE